MKPLSWGERFEGTLLWAQLLAIGVAVLALTVMLFWQLV